MVLSSIYQIQVMLTERKQQIKKRFEKRDNQQKIQFKDYLSKLVGTACIIVLPVKMPLFQTFGIKTHEGLATFLLFGFF